MTVVVKGFQVVEPGPGRARPLSRVFAVRDAAEQFAQLARKRGHPGAVVEAIFAAEQPAGANQELSFG